MYALRNAAGHYVEDVFGDPIPGYYKHALIKPRASADNIFAVGITRSRK